MVRQLFHLTVGVVAILGQTDVSTCGALFSTGGKCQNDSTGLLQVAYVPETFPFRTMVKPEKTSAKTSKNDSGGHFGPAGPKHQKDAVMISMNDWHSSRDLAHVRGMQNVAISPNWTLQIFSAVPVFGKDNETYIALLVDHDGHAYNLVEPNKKWARDFRTFVMFCAGPDGSHKTQVITRGISWVCPWPREEWESKKFKVLLEDKHGTNLGMVLAEHDPKLLGQYNTMACVRDIFHVPNQERQRPFSGPFKQWVEWMEWSSMHGLEHFLIYTFEGTDFAAIDLMKPYLDAGIASRVHFQFFHPLERVRLGHSMNDCIYRAKNHAKWLATSVDVDEYLVFPGKVNFFNWDHILKEQGISKRKVASLELRRVRFARARPEAFEISSDHRVPASDPLPKQILNVDNAYSTSIHWLQSGKAGARTILVDPKFAVIHHYRAATGSYEFSSVVDYEHFDFNDPGANMTDETLQKDMPMLEAAIATRFNIQASAVKGFLKNLAQRHPPNSATAAAAHADMAA